jgi:peptidoglycan/xylan/chitin deacetylase (PgdA/CDA1 family)
VTPAESSGVDRVAPIYPSGVDRIYPIDVDPAYRPDWFQGEAGTHVPLPPAAVAVCRETLPGQPLLWANTDTGRLTLISLDAGEPYIRYDWSSWKRYVLGEHYRTLARPMYTRLPFHYHRIPSVIRRAVAKGLLAHQTPAGAGGGRFPGFPIEQGFELLAHVWTRVSARAAAPGAGPGATRTGPPIVLTHDIDTGDGFPWVRRTAELELAHGFRSVWHVVGRGDPPDYGVLDWLVEQGCTIGLHGYNHDNKLAFLSADRIRRRLDACRPLIQRYDMQCFRSPSWFRSDTLFDVLSEYLQVDYSRLDTDRSCPGGVGGCLWTKPFSLGGLTHVPTTVPFEDPLYWGCEPEHLVDFWRPKLEWLRGCGGGIVVNTHPEPQFSGNARMMGAYDQLLNVLASASSPDVRS